MSIMTPNVAAQQPNQNINDDYFSGPLVIKNDAIQPALPPLDIINTQPTNHRTNTSSLAYTGRHYSKEEVERLIQDYSASYGVDVELAKRIAWCESGYNQFAKNKSSSASGVYQYLSGTWAGTDEGKQGISVFDAEANVRAAIKYVASRGHAKPWTASQHCWSK